MASEVSFAQCGRARNVVRLTRHVSEQMQRVHYGKDVVAVVKKCEYLVGIPVFTIPERWISPLPHIGSTAREHAIVARQATFPGED